MTVYLEMALRLNQEIEAAEAHLVNLKIALAALQPLITVESAPATRALSYAPSTTLVEDVEARDILVPGKKTGKPPRVKTRPAEAGDATLVAKLPSTNAAFWIKLMGKRRHTIADVVDRAAAALGTGEESRPVLANRFQAWIYPAIKSSVVEHVGVKGKLKAYRVVSR